MGLGASRQREGAAAAGKGIEKCTGSQPPRVDAKSKAAAAPVAQQPSVEQLARQLASTDAKARHAAADELADLGRRAAAATPALAKALASEDADTRWRAARAIGEVGAARLVLAKRSPENSPIANRWSVRTRHEHSG